MNRPIPNNYLNFINSLSPSIRVISSITIVGYLLSYSETAVQALSVIPGNLLPSTFAIWTAFTFCFLEFHIWEVIVDIVVVTLCLKLIEPLWDQIQVMTFFAVVNLSVAVLSSFYYLCLYSITKNTEILFEVKIHGLIGFLAGLCVAIMAIMPNLLIARTPFGNFTNRNIPITFMACSILLWALNLISGQYSVMFCSGLVSSFIYLRFYQRHANGVRGTNAENFTFANFFPTATQPVINFIVNPIYKMSLNIGLVKHQPIFPLNHPSSSDIRSMTMSISPSDQQDNERRRAIALKALNERWKALNSDPQKSQLPKSFPQTSSMQQQHQQQQQHQAGFSHHGHSHERKVIPKFNIDEIMKPIPMPAPPGMMSTSETTPLFGPPSTSSND
ncbi:CLUMA_CG017242, isoform A [Clunio marinus]|uniref:CLUMA_CG017242, isoform A n=1 Tax=Clunio marinus TaxID=568069 RepID=A0A1J1IV49_9DIPT|nr:CLUMA_CG017242, isoform A [Clunio marinus]